MIRARGASIAVDEVFAEGDLLELELPLEAEFVHPDPRIDAVRGCVAVQRGPVVYCAQSLVDEVGAPDLADIVVDTGTPPRTDAGAVVVDASRRLDEDADWPYSSDEALDARTANAALRLIPYHDWGQAGPCTMRSSSQTLRRS